MKIAQIAFGLGAGALLSLAGGVLPAHEAAAAECIAPAAPGGGWDFTCRTIGKLLYDLKLVDAPVRVENISGASGAVAFANVIGSRNSEGDLLVATSTQSSVMLAQGKYPGDTSAVRWVATLGADVGVLFVNKDSPYNSLGELLAAVKANPTGISSGGGIYDYLRFLMLAQKADVPLEDLKKIRMIYYAGCGESIPAVMGDHIQVSVCDLGEAAGFVESGDIKVLAVMGDQRSAAPFDKIPTAKEQGYDVVGYNWRGFYVGGDVSDEDYNKWVDIMKKVYDSPEWQDVLNTHGLTPLWKGGPEFETFVNESVAQMRELSNEVGMNQ
jgi:putative tricarboxylic transport membrane protein